MLKQGLIVHLVQVREDGGRRGENGTSVTFCNIAKGGWGLMLYIYCTSEMGGEKNQYFFSVCMLAGFSSVLYGGGSW